MGAANINIRKQATLSFAGNVLDTGVSFLGLIAMAYILGAADLGKYYFILAVVSVVLFPVNGLGQAILKRCSEESMPADTVYTTGLVMAIAYVTIVSIGFGAVAITGLVPLRFRPAILVAAVTVFLTRAVLFVQIDSYRGYGYTGRATLVDNIYGILQTLLQLGILALGYRIFGLLVATTVATLCTVVCHYAVSTVTFSSPAFKTVSSLIEYARWSVITSGMSTLYERLPVLVLGFVGLNAAVGYYTSANRLLMLGSYISGSLKPPLMAKISSYGDNTLTESIFEEFRSVHHHVTVLAVALAFGSFALSSSLMAIFFDMTAPVAGSVLIGLSIYHVIRSLTRIEYALFAGLDMPDIGTKGIGVALVVLLVFLPLLLQSYGLLGVVVAVVLAHFTALLFAQTIFWKKFGKLPLPGGLTTQLPSGIAMFLIVELTVTTIGVSSIPLLLLTIGIGGAVYIASLVALDQLFRDLVFAVIEDIIAIL